MTLEEIEEGERLLQELDDYGHPDTDASLVDWLCTHRHALIASAKAAAWRPIEGPMTGHFLVTNNIGGRDNDGSMSHVWLVRMIHQNSDQFSAFDDNLTKIHGLTHYRPIGPLPEEG